MRPAEAPAQIEEDEERPTRLVQMEDEERPTRLAAAAVQALGTWRPATAAASVAEAAQQHSAEASVACACRLLCEGKAAAMKAVVCGPLGLCVPYPPPWPRRPAALAR
jgi:hypothetical protein